MEPEEKLADHKNGIKKELYTDLLKYLTTLNLNHNKSVINSNMNVSLPQTLINVSLEYNELNEVPENILKLENLKYLNLSHNCIKYFDQTPKFYKDIEELDMSNNHLHGPPYWIWFEAIEKLRKLNLSCNISITNAFELNDNYYKEIIQYRTPIIELRMYHCKLAKYLSILQTFPNVTHLELGEMEFNRFRNNYLEDIPFRGLESCCDVSSLNVSNTHIFNVKSSINKYKNLKEINLSLNLLTSLPKEFADLENLEICILSFNKILYLPNNFVQLNKLKCLRLDNNELCMLPEDESKLFANLETLDLYDNYLYGIPEYLYNIPALDIAQNYLDEPGNAEYLQRRNTLRMVYNFVDRHNGRKKEIESPESEHSPDTTDDEEFLQWSQSNGDAHSPKLKNDDPLDSSSSEDWDSDDYWVPRYLKYTPPPQSPWLYFVRRKMEEGNFCPMDIHPVSIAEQIQYEKLCNPPVVYESDGQFDDYSSDDT